MSGKNKSKKSGRPQKRSSDSAHVNPGSRPGIPLIQPSGIGNTVVFPAKLRRTFTSSGNVDLTGTGLGTMTSSTLSLNSLYDPDYSGVGNVPRWYNTLLGSSGSNAPYGKYCVMAARLRVEFINTKADNSGLADVGIFVRNEYTNVPDQAAELYTSEYAHAKAIGSGYAATGIVSMGVDIPTSLFSRLMRCKDLEDAEDNHGPYNGDPPVQILVDLCMQHFLSSSTELVIARWTLEQDAILFALNESNDITSRARARTTTAKSPVDSTLSPLKSGDPSSAVAGPTRGDDNARRDSHPHPNSSVPAQSCKCGHS